MIICGEHTVKITASFGVYSMKPAPKFRNRLVYVYWDISPEVVYTIIHDNLEDINRYLKQIALYVTENNL